MKKFKFKIYPLEPAIETRRAKKSDKLMQIAELLYSSNPKMFEFFNKNRVYGCEDLINMFYERGSVFYYKNIFVAAQKSKIWGVLVALTPDTELTYNYEWFKRKKPNYKVVCENYFEKMPSKLKPSTVFIPHIFVHEAYRNFTVGRKLILTCESYFMSKGYKYCEVYNIVGNELLTNLLTNMNFKKVDDYLDFATANEKQQVSIYRREIKEDEYYR